MSWSRFYPAAVVHERVDGRRWLAVGVISLGVILIAGS